MHLNKPQINASHRRTVNYTSGGRKADTNKINHQKTNKDMSYQIITKMAYNAETRQIETWQHSNNVWPRTDYYYSFDATDENLYNVIKWHAQGVWQGRKWAKQFAAVFAEFPELIEWRTAWDNAGTYDDKRYLVHLADVEAERNKAAIVARFRELAKIA